MENIKNSNNSLRNGRIMTLKSYYKNLPAPTHPKKEFIRDVATKCGVSEATVRNWVMYGFRPVNEEHIKVLSEATGISADNLWID